MTSGRGKRRVAKRVSMAIAAWLILFPAPTVHLSVESSAAGAAVAAETTIESETLVLEAGDTLATLLDRSGVPAAEADSAIRSLRRHVDPRKLRPGHRLSVFTHAADTGPALVGLVLDSGDDQGVAAAVGPGGIYKVTVGTPAALRGDLETVRIEPATAGEPLRITRTLRLPKGGTLEALLSGAGLEPGETAAAIRTLRQGIDLRRLRPGQVVEITLAWPLAGNGGGVIAGIALPNRNGGGYAAVRDGRVFEGNPIGSRDDGGGDGTTAAADAAAPDEAESREAAAPRYTSTVRTLQRNQTLLGVLHDAGVDGAAAHAIIAALAGVIDPRRLQAGDRIAIYAGDDAEGVKIATRAGPTVTVAKRPDSTFAVGAPVVAPRAKPGIETETAIASRAADKADTAARTEAQEGRSGYAAATAVAGEPAEDANGAAFDRPADEGFDLEAPDAAVAAATQPPPSALATLPHVERVTATLDRGDTLMKVLVDAGTDRAEAHAAVLGIRPVFNPRRLRAGTDVALAFHPMSGLSKPVLAGFSVDVDAETRVEVVRIAEGRFVPQRVPRPMFRQVVRAEGTIDHSLYADAIGAGVSPAILMKLVKMFSYDIDFQRDLQRGDRFELLYERFVDDHGDAVREGEVLFAAMTLGGERYPLYRHELADGTVDYFNDKGESARKALLRTPIDGARLSSGYGMRRHPVLGYTRMHKGLDFAAPQGTPILAAGDGVVDRASRFGAYGLYVRIRHGDEYSTAYAHLSALADGVRAGRRVRQNDVIGYVGSTGRSTGPHLHYEVLHNGAQVNPMKVDMPTGLVLTGAERERFEDRRTTLQAMFAGPPRQVALPTGLSSGR